MADNDPLNKLLINADEIDRNRLAEALANLIGIDRDSGRIAFKSDYNNLNSKQKVLCYILAIKVCYLLEMRDSDRIANKNVVSDTGLPKGTVAPKLKELKEQRLITQDEDSNYFVASHQIINSIEEVEK